MTHPWNKKNSDIKNNKTAKQLKGKTTIKVDGVGHSVPHSTTSALRRLKREDRKLKASLATFKVRLVYKVPSSQ